MDKKPDPFANIKAKLDQFYNHPDNSDKHYEALKLYISKKEDLDLSHYRDKYLHRRFYYRLLRLNVNSYRTYLKYIKENPEESALFRESFTIHVTEFFRDVKPFTYFKEDLIPKIIKAKAGKTDKTIRILSAPCSTGEEPYSLAMIIDELKSMRKLPNPVEITAFDIEQKVIRFAQEGIYPKNTLKNISPVALKRHFYKIDDDHYQIRPNIKKYVSFGISDLLKPLTSRTTYDFIACRNFLIYISKPNQKIVINHLVEHLVTSGFLMLGKTEGFPLLSARTFGSENLKEHIYQLKQPITK